MSQSVWISYGKWHFICKKKKEANAPIWIMSMSKISSMLEQNVFEHPFIYYHFLDIMMILILLWIKKSIPEYCEIESVLFFMIFSKNKLYHVQNWGKNKWN